MKSAAALAIKAAICDAAPGVVLIGAATFWPRFDVLIKDPVAKLNPTFGGWYWCDNTWDGFWDGAGVVGLWGGEMVDERFALPSSFIR